MKRIASIICLAVLFVSSLWAQTQDNVYIYRNDGEFHAFFAAEIDSITYSEYDLAGVQQEDVVTQVVWTKDSTYRIPLELIDSVSFGGMVVKYNKEVVQMDASWLPYVVGVNDLDITFSSAIFDKWTPQVGTILLYMAFDATFPDGFAGRVTEVTNGGEVLVQCEEVDIDDVWEELIVVGEYALAKSEQKPVRQYGALDDDVDDDDDDDDDDDEPDEGTATGKMKFKYKLDLGDDDCSLKGSAGITIKVVYYKKDGDFTLEVTPSFNAKAAFEINNEFKFEKSYTFPKDLVILENKPLPQFPALLCDLSVGAEVGVKLSGGVTAKYELSKKGYTKFTYTNGKWTKDQNAIDAEAGPAIEGSFDGEAWISLPVNITLKIPGKLFSFTMTPKPTTSLEAHLSDGFTKFLNTGEGYDSFKDASIALHQKVNLDVTAKFQVYKWSVSWTKKDLLEIDYIMRRWFFLPIFSSSDAEITNNKATLHCKALERRLLFDVNIGYALFGEDKKNPLQAAYECKFDGNEVNMWHTFSDLDWEQCYTARPIVKWKGFEFFATPQRGFCIGEKPAPSIVGSWTCTGYSYTPPKSQLKKMVCGSDGSLDMTYYYTSDGSTKTYHNQYTYDPYTKSFVMIKTNGDTQYWTVTKLTESSLVIQSATDGFEYHFSR